MPRLLVRARIDPRLLAPHRSPDSSDPEPELSERAWFLLRRLQQHAIIQRASGRGEAVPDELREELDRCWRFDVEDETKPGRAVHGLLPPDPIHLDTWEKWAGGALADVVSSGRASELRDDILALVRRAQRAIVLDRYALSENSRSGWRNLIAHLPPRGSGFRLEVICCGAEQHPDVAQLLRDEALGDRDRIEVSAYEYNDAAYQKAHDRFLLLQMDSIVAENSRLGTGWWAVALGQGIRALAESNENSWVHVLHPLSALHWLRWFRTQRLERVAL
jgi:hypothetical protein